ncbi:HupE/UreJ family protein [Vibrio lentus]|uniref:HupE/UreJ family protein n=1 Tax=Vibrio lentus TaxID=136468 RepID=UPI003D0B84EE
MNFKTAAGLCTFTIASLTTSTLAFAHPGHGSHSVHESHSFMSGLTHPVTGMDHLIMLIAFGLLIGALSFSTKTKAALIGGGLVSLVVGLIAGQASGFSVIVEPAIIASLFVVSLCLWHVFSPSTKRVNSVLVASIGMLFFHGYAHGVEAASNLTQFAAGMSITALVLMIIGTFVGRAVYSKWMSVGVASASALLLLGA